MKGLSARLRGIAVTVILAAVVVRRGLRRKQETSQTRLGVRHFRDRESAEAALAMTAGDVSGSVGFSSWHVESGRSFGLNGDRRFPMASLIKLSVALHTFRRIDAGTASLRDVVELAPRHWRPGSGLLAQYVTSRPIRVSVDTLLREMIQESDNTATDALLEWLGGPDAIQRDLGPLALGVVAPTRTIDGVLRDLHGLPPRDGGPGTVWWRDLSAAPKAQRQAAASVLFTDPRDAACPDDFVAFLRALWEGRFLSESSRKRLLDLMAHVRTGDERILAGLPRGSWLAHKTGSFEDRYAADVGVARLPDGSHLMLAAHVWSASPDRDQVIARLTAVAVGFFGASP